MEIQVKKINSKRVRYNSNSIRLSSHSRSDLVYPNECGMFATGVAVNIQDTNVVGVLFPKQGISFGNALGIIDSDFQGEIRVGVINLSYNPKWVKEDLPVGELFFMPIMRSKSVDIVPLNEKVTLPQYATPGAAGMDIFANIHTPITIYPNETLALATGFKVIIHTPDMVGMVLPRSSMGVKNRIGLADTVSLLRYGVTEELIVRLINNRSSPYTVSPQDRIAQLVFFPILNPQFTTVSTFTNDTARSSEGFGTTGK